MEAKRLRHPRKKRVRDQYSRRRYDSLAAQWTTNTRVESRSRDTDLYATQPNQQTEGCLQLGDLDDEGGDDASDRVCLVVPRVGSQP